MSRLYNCVMGSVDSCPYAPRSNYNLFSAIGKALGSIGGPLVSGGLSLLGDIFNSNAGQSSQDAANRTNFEIARMNNEQQYKMFQEQNAFNLDMWNKQNAYNDPKEQVKRLLAAGINPAGVFGNGSVSEAGSLESAPAPQLQQAHVSPYQPDYGVGRAVNAFMQSQMANAEIKEKNENVRHLSIQNDLDALQLRDKIQNLKLDNESKQQYNNWFDHTFDLRQKSLELNNQNLDAQTKLFQQQALSMQIHSDMEKRLGESQLKLNEKQLWAISNYVAQNWEKLLLDAQHIKNETSSVQAQNAYLGNSVIHMMQQDAGYFEQLGISKEMMSSEKFKNYAAPIGSILGNLLGAAGGAFFGAKGVFQAAPKVINGFFSK